MLAWAPYQRDELSRYLPALDGAAPFVWCLAPEHLAGADALAVAMRRDDVTGSLADPWPSRLFASADELRALCDASELDALVQAYERWAASVRPKGLQEHEYQRVVEMAQAQGGAAELERVRYRHAVELHATYGRPSTTLDLWDVWRWAVMAGLFKPPAQERPEGPEGGVVGRLGAYLRRLKKGGTDGR